MLKFNPKAGNFRITLPIIRVGGDSFLLRFFSGQVFSVRDSAIIHPTSSLAPVCSGSVMQAQEYPEAGEGSPAPRARSSQLAKGC